MASENRKPEWEKAFRYARLLTELVDRHGLSELVLEEGGVKITARREIPQAPSGMHPFHPLPQSMQSSAYTGHGMPQYPQGPFPHPGAFGHPFPGNGGAAGAPQGVKQRPAPAATEIDEAKTIRAPMAGTFYRAPSPGAPNFVEGGAHIESGKVLCIIEAMKLMNEIKAEKSGTIARILVENGKPVRTGDPLFILG